MKGRRKTNWIILTDIFVLTETLFSFFFFAETNSFLYRFIHCDDAANPLSLDPFPSLKFIISLKNGFTKFIWSPALGIIGESGQHQS